MQENQKYQIPTGKKKHPYCLFFFKLRGTVARINCHIFTTKDALLRSSPSYYLRKYPLFYHTLANTLAVHPVAMVTDQYQNLTMINLFLS